MNPIVSVIVPVFNSAGYLRECLDNLLSQDYPHLEVVLVDDGSTDGSRAICSEYSERDRRVRVFSQSNAGVGRARRRGVEHAAGDYVAFVDSDDLIAPDFISTLMSAVARTGCKLVRLRAGTKFRDGEVPEGRDDDLSLPEISVLDAVEVQKSLMYQAMETGFQWHLMSKALATSVQWSELRVFEDLATVYRIVAQVRSVAVVDCPSIYKYRIRTSSLTLAEYSHEKSVAAISVGLQLEEDISAWYPQLADAATSRSFSVARSVYAQLSGCRDCTKRFVADETSLWHVLSARARTVVLDRDARARERIAACCVLAGRSTFRGFCRTCRAFRLMG